MRYYSSFTFHTGAIPPRDLSADLDTTRVLEASEGVTPFSSGAFFPSTEKLACHHQRVKDPTLSLLFLRLRGNVLTLLVCCVSMMMEKFGAIIMVDG